MNSTPSRLRVGIIGAGWPGERHAEGYLACPEADLLAISDLEPTRRTAFAHTYQVPRSYADYAELLADPQIEAVSVALPNHLHRPATLAALAAGKHVLCEKPPALTLAQAEEMAHVAEQQGRLLGYAVQRRFHPSTVALQQQLAQGRLGTIYHARAVWTRAWDVPRGVGGWFVDPQRAGGGAMIDIGIHVLDTAWYLLGCPAPRTVSAHSYNAYMPDSALEDCAFGLLRFADGCSLHLAVSWALAQDNDQMGVFFYGTQGGARVDDNSLDLYGVGEAGRSRSSPILPYDALRRAFAAQADNFVQAVLHGAPLRTPADHGVQLMAMLDAVYRSAAAGREVVL